MTQRVADGLAVISLSPFISVINYVHSAHGVSNPNDNRAVRQVRDGLRRTYGVAPVRQAHPLSVAEIRTLVTGIDRATLGGARDAAFILVGYAGALRIGGQLVHLHCAERGQFPDGIGERAGLRQGVTSSPTLPTAGGTQALQRSETIGVTVAGREGSVRRPNLVGALVDKAAALSNAGDPGLGRHRRDFVILAGLLTARDFRSEELTKKDRQRLRAMVAAVQRDRVLLLEVPNAEVSLNRLSTAAEL